MLENSILELKQTIEVLIATLDKAKIPGTIIDPGQPLDKVMISATARGLSVGQGPTNKSNDDVSPIIIEVEELLSMASKAAVNHKDAVKALVKSFNVSSISAIPADKRYDFFIKLKEITDGTL